MLKFLFSLLEKFKVYFVNSAWIVLGYFIRLLMTIFIVSKIANQIGAEDFGWYNLGISFFTILFSVSTLGFTPDFIIKHLVDHKENLENQKKVLGTFFFSRLFFSLIILLFLFVWVYLSNTDPKYWVVLIASSAILFQSSRALSAYFQWKLEANIYVSVTIISLFISSALLIFGLYYDLSVYFFMGVYAFERFFILLGTMVAFHLKVFPVFTLKYDFSLLKYYFTQAWPLLLGALLTALYGRFDQFLIKYFLTIKELGIYGTSVILTQVWLVIPSLIVPVLYPRIVQLKKDGKKKEYEKTILVLYALLNYSALFITIITLFFGEYIIVGLYGKEYLDSNTILKVLVFNLIILFQSHLTTSVLILEGKEKYLFKIKLISVISNILLNILFLSNFGIIYAAYSLIISSILSWIVLSVFDKTMFNLVKLNFKSFVFPLYLNK